MINSENSDPPSELLPEEVPTYTVLLELLLDE
jgi:hypothetical protein